MKNILLSICLITYTGISAQAPEDIVRDFFTAISKKDISTLDRLTLDDMQLHSLMLSDSIELSATTKDKFLRDIRALPTDLIIEEKIFDIQSLIVNRLAQFQVPYRFYVNDKLSHSGVNVLTLLNTKDGWRVSYIADTRKM